MRGGLKTPELRHENSIRLETTCQGGSPLKIALQDGDSGGVCSRLLSPKSVVVAHLCRIGSLATRLGISFGFSFEILGWFRASEMPIPHYFADRSDQARCCGFLDALPVAFVAHGKPAGHLKESSLMESYGCRCLRGVDK